MPPQPKTPQATPLTDAAALMVNGLLFQDRQVVVPIAFARQLETALHALAGALGEMQRLEYDARQHDARTNLKMAWLDERSKAVEASTAALAAYRTLTSADERRGG